MKFRTRLLLLLAGPVMYALSCSSPNAPEGPAGGIVVRFVPPAEESAAGGGDAPASSVVASFDSVAVRVFRAGSPLAQEARAGAPVAADPVELSIPCIAELNKRVSVELFSGGVMTYHGVDEDVDVAAGKRTTVTVDAYPFLLSGFSATPDIVNEGAAFSLAWSSVAGARTYVVQASRTMDFSTIEWQAALSDTVTSAHLGTGTHYFRVAPRTPFAIGTFAGPELAYVMGGAGSVSITGFSAPGVIPGDPVTIRGENLDYPDVKVTIGADSMRIVSASWDELVVLMPRAAKTNYVSVTNKLGSDVSANALLALRFAYVTRNGEYLASFGELLWNHANDVEWNFVAMITLPELDTRDMSVFDVIVVANDTGTDLSNWGDGIPARATAITTSGANVLAMGDGGLAFLSLAFPSFRVPVTVGTETSCYVPNTSRSIFQTPHSVISPSAPLGGWLDVCSSKERELALENPPGTTRHASTGVGSANWVFVETLVAGRRYFFWGFAADPKGFTDNGKNFMANVLTALYST